MTSEPHDRDVLTAFEGDLPGTVTPSALRRRIKRYLPALVLAFLVLVAWEVLVRVFNVQEFILAKPSEIYATFLDEFDTVVEAGWTTLREAVLGLVLGTLFGVLAALATARWSGIREGVMPFAVAANSIPILALAPIANQWFGLTSLTAKAAVVAVIVFFPVMINTVRGLTEVDAGELELMRALAAPPRDVVTRVRLPNALPYFFSALKVAAALAVIGAIVAEYFGGRTASLGFYITQQAGAFKFAEAWSGIIVGSVLGIAIYAFVLGLERWAMPWHVSLRAADDR
ncbi:MAG: ABC transporter permease [Acidimicrobiia bacterium]|nr:ABC transporter permease [Acidimicrobiia bacterium]MBT8217603.1 ABC transporter permease [Acidimicrobiia bacterium]NNF10847.1 ABC transporter permease [Acidimicrobiia bacterium]NNL71166.1 ABC transporter permease [Acidimicrobiia bacterium]